MGAWAHAAAGEGSGRAASTPETVSVVICTYSGERLGSLVELLEALPRQRRQPEEVIVVVDGNETLEATLRARFPDAVVLANHGPRGHAAAANRGVNAARGEVVAFIDDDAVPADERWLELLLAAYGGDEVLGVGGRVEPRWLARRPWWFPDEFLWVLGASNRGLPTSRQPVRNLWMDNMSVRRELFGEVGGFRTSLSRVGARPFATHETEFCIRAAQRRPGGFFLYEPRARVLHDVPTRRATFAYFRSHCFDEAVAKEVMARYVGRADGLATERDYLTRVLPAGLARGVGDALRGDPAGLGRAAAIVVGTAVAGCGFARARLRPLPLSDDEEVTLGEPAPAGRGR